MISFLHVLFVVANADSFNLVVNNGAAAGQVIYHVSCYVIVCMLKQNTSQGILSEVFKSDNFLV